jgi:hypothetical protein
MNATFTATFVGSTPPPGSSLSVGSSQTFTVTASINSSINCPAGSVTFFGVSSTVVSASCLRAFQNFPLMAGPNTVTLSQPIKTWFAGTDGCPGLPDTEALFAAPCCNGSSPACETQSLPLNVSYVVAP